MLAVGLAGVAWLIFGVYGARAAKRSVRMSVQGFRLQLRALGVVLAAIVAGVLVTLPTCRRSPDAGAHQHRTQSVQDRRAVPQDAGRAHVGIDERGRHRSRRAQHLGWRALRREHVSRSRDGPDVEPAVDPEVRCVRQAGGELRSGHADLPARHARRSRRQPLGDRRTGRCAAAGARRAGGARGSRTPRRRALARCQARRAVIRCSSSARKASCS